MTAEERLVSMLGGSTTEPLLTSDELTDCLLMGAVQDAQGLYTDDHLWVPTYDFHRAAAAGWRRKAARVAADYSVTIEGRELNRGQMVDNFLKMAQAEDAMSAPRFFSTAASEPWRV